MSGFQILVTPTRVRNARIASAAREPTDCFMAPFSAKAVVTFEDVPLTKTARRTLQVFNPTELPLLVRVQRTIDPALGLHSDWPEGSSTEIPAHGCHTVQLAWTPVAAFSYRGSMQLIDQRNFKKDVLFVMRSIDRAAKAKTATATTATTATAAAKRATVTLQQKPVRVAKSPVPAAKRRGAASVQVTATMRAKVQQNYHRMPVYAAASSEPTVDILGSHNHAAPSASTSPAAVSSSTANGKENIVAASAVNPLDSLFHDIQFTPDHAHHVQSQHMLSAKQQTPKQTAAGAISAVPLWAMDTPQDAIVTQQSGATAATSGPNAIESGAAAAAAFSPTVFSTARRSVSPQEQEMLRRKLFAEAVAAGQSPSLCSADQQFNIQMSTDKMHPLLPATTPRRHLAERLSPRSTDAMDGGSTIFGQRLLVMTSPLRGAAGQAASGGGLSPVSPVTGRLLNQGHGLAIIREESSFAAAAPIARPTRSIDELSCASTSHSEAATALGQRTYICANRSAADGHSSTATTPTATSTAASSPTQYASVNDLAASTPLSKNFASMQNLHQGPAASAVAAADRQSLLLWSCAQGSMPNLTDMALVRPIESNRYFYQAGAVPVQTAAATATAAASAAEATSAPSNAHSVHDLNFRETEIAAQSSRLNLTLSTSLASVAGVASTTALPTAYSTFVVDRSMGAAASAQRHSPQSFAMPAQRPLQQRPSARQSAAAAASASRPSTGALPTELRHQRTTSLTTLTPTKAGAPRMMRTSPTPPLPLPHRRSNSSSSSTGNLHKRVRDETAEQSMRRSFKHSPPKRLRQHQTEGASGSPIRSAKSTSSLARGETTHRLSVWGGMRPMRGPSSNSSRSVVSLNALLRQRPVDVAAVPLFDADMHIQTLINPDAFAASTTVDPFLAATMYLDEQCIERHQAEFKRWLNALVTIPEHDQPTTESVDFGQLFHSVRHRADAGVADTRETVSARQLTHYRLDGLRRAAIALYTSDELSVPLAKLVVQIERRQIAIRDRDLHVDVVLQRQLLELLLCFNPLWLRLGLEITFGEQIAMRHSGDLLALSAFVVRRLFRDRQLDERTTPLQRRQPEYVDGQRKFTLKKTLTLLVFLDAAKRRRLIRHNPCLFVLGAELKDMRSVLMRYASSYIANLGDVQKDLRRIGIVLEHRQSYLDEFDYAFRNLAVDLRDGVRLSRVMEILLLRDDLMDRLRVPAISRLQRVHNVEVALGAWREADFVMCGGITGTDIADGHREKTLSLLWQLIHKFRSPKFHAAASTLQRWWRNAHFRLTIRRRADAKLLRRRAAAAVVIQAAFRGRRGRRLAVEYVQRRHAAAVCLQAYARRWLVLRQLHFAHTCAVYIQRWFRATMRSSRERQQFVALRDAALVVQVAWRRRRLAGQLQRAAEIIALQQQESRSRWRAAMLLQRRFREWRRTKVDRAGFLRERHAAVAIQRRWRAVLRMRTARERFGQLRAGALVVQRLRRAQLVGRLARTEYEQLRSAAVTVQRHWRAMRAMRSARANFAQLRSAAVALQARFRARCTMRAQRSAYAALRDATIVCQRRRRALLDERRARRLEAQRNACTVVQRRFRALLSMRSVSFDYQRLRDSALTVQRHWRARRARRQQSERFAALRSAAVCVQRRWRAVVAMRTQHLAFERQRCAAVTVQRRFRAQRQMRLERAAFERLRCSVVAMQQRFRARQMAALQRNEYLTLRGSVVAVQRRFCAQLAMRRQRTDYLRQRAACVTIQQRVRARWAMCSAQLEYGRLRAAAVCVQLRFRARAVGRRVAEDFRRQRAAAVCLQQRYRAQRGMRRQRTDYQLLRHAAILIQHRRRAQLAMRQHSHSYHQLRASTVRVQRLFRARCAARTQLAAYTQLRVAVTCIQRRWRAQLAMRRQRTAFRRLHEAAICIQQRRRALTQMRSERARFADLLSAARCLQRHFRARRSAIDARDHYQRLRSAAILIQTNFRAHRLTLRIQSDYLELKLAAVRVQRTWRALLTGRQQRIRFVQLRSAAVCVQQRFRARLAMLPERDRLQRLRTAAVCIQRRWRATLAMRTQRQQFAGTLRCVRLVQRQFRANCAARSTREHFVRLRCAAIVVQQRFRARLLQRQLRQQFLLIRSLAVAVQQKFRARRWMLHQRAAFQRLRTAAVVLQRAWRSRQLMQRQRSGYRRLCAIVSGLQAHARGWVARRRFAAQRPQLLQLVRRMRAVQLLQRVWRGFVVRRRCERRVTAIRRQLCEATGRAEPQQRLGVWVQGAVRLLNGRTNVHEVLRTLLRLVKVSRETPQVLIADAEFICNFCYGIMAQAIRSEVDKQKIELCSCVILNLSRFDGTKEMALQSHGLVTVAQMLLRWCDKECAIFNTLCSVIYVQVQCSRMRAIIYEYMTGHDAIFMLRETKKMVIRKERMRANRAPNPLMAPLSAQQRSHLPQLQPDFGLSSASTTYVFNCSVFAFDTILHELAICV